MVYKDAAGHSEMHVCHVPTRQYLAAALHAVLPNDWAFIQVQGSRMGYTPSIAAEALTYFRVSLPSDFASISPPLLYPDK